MVACGHVVDCVYGCSWLCCESCLYLPVVMLWLMFLIDCGYVVVRVYD